MVYKKDLEQQKKWSSLTRKLGDKLGKRPKDLTSVLYLIGIQELGKGKQDFSKEEKQDLIHIAICKIMSFAGFYQLEGVDQDGWPHWKLIKPLPGFDILEQEQLLKTQIIEYFEKEVGMFV
jgi:hypothetical protein